MFFLLTMLLALLVLVVRLLLLTGQTVAVILLAIALFVLAVMYAVLRIVQWLLPYILRAASILAWAVSLFFVFVAVSNLYTKFSDAVAAMLTAGLFTLIVAVAPMAFNRLGGDALFGGYLFAALGGLGVKMLCESVTPTFYPAASVIPPALAGMCLIMVVIQRKERSRNARLESVE